MALNQIDEEHFSAIAASSNIVLEQVMRRPWPNGWSGQMRVLAPPT